MKVGLVAPVFARSPRQALSVAQHADNNGIDGVFSYDHLFPPVNRPDLPALSAIPMLAAMAARTERIRIGTLVSRVTLLPVPALVSALVTLNEISGHRLIAGLGTGDSITNPENRAYGLAFPPFEERLLLLIEATRALRAEGVTTWIGGRSIRMRGLASAEADGWNSWDGPLEDLAAFAAANRGGAATVTPGGAATVTPGGAATVKRGGVATTWGGPPPADGDFEADLRRLGGAGVEWVAYGPPPSVDWTALVLKLAGAAEAVQ